MTPAGVLHERELQCTACGAHIIVGGWVDDIDETTYTGVSCGCRKPIQPWPLQYGEWPPGYGEAA